MQKVWGRSIKSFSRLGFFCLPSSSCFVRFFFCLCKAFRLYSVIACALLCIRRMKNVGYGIEAVMLYTFMSMHIPNWIETQLFPFSSIWWMKKEKILCVQCSDHLNWTVARIAWQASVKTHYVCTIHINGKKISSIHRNCVHSQWWNIWNSWWLKRDEKAQEKTASFLSMELNAYAVFLLLIFSWHF